MKCNKANKGADNAFLWLPPNGKRDGDVLIANTTLWAYTFGCESGLQRLWKNLFG